jgi:hypothetical protein
MRTLPSVVNPNSRRCSPVEGDRTAQPVNGHVQRLLVGKN